MRRGKGCFWPSKQQKQGLEQRLAEGTLAESHCQGLEGVVEWRPGPPGPRPIGTLQLPRFSASAAGSSEVPTCVFKSLFCAVWRVDEHGKEQMCMAMEGLCQMPREEATPAWTWADVGVRLCESQDHSHLCVGVSVVGVSCGRWQGML